MRGCALHRHDHAHCHRQSSVLRPGRKSVWDGSPMSRYANEAMVRSRRGGPACDRCGGEGRGGLVAGQPGFPADTIAFVWAEVITAAQPGSRGLGTCGPVRPRPLCGRAFGSGYPLELVRALTLTGLTCIGTPAGASDVVPPRPTRNPLDRDGAASRCAAPPSALHVVASSGPYPLRTARRQPTAARRLPPIALSAPAPRSARCMAP